MSASMLMGILLFHDFLICTLGLYAFLIMKAIIRKKKEKMLENIFNKPKG